MTGSNAGEHPTFVARLWLEEGPEEKLLWRGKIKHVQGEREAYFDSLDELELFLQEVSGGVSTWVNASREPPANKQE